MEGVFNLPATGYVRDTEILSSAKLDMAVGLSKLRGIPLSHAINFVEESLAPGGELALDDARMLITTKDKNEDRRLTTTTASKFLNKVYSKGLIMSPTMTVYKPKSMEMAYTTTYLINGINNRKLNKAAAFKFLENNDKDNYSFKWNEQSVDKILNNGLSGAECTRSTILHCASIHPTLTSTCRVSTGYANSNNERVLAGNRHYRSPEIAEANLLATIRLADLKLVEEVVNKYNLTLPTTSDVMDMVSASSKYYWTDTVASNRIRQMVDGFTPIERAAVMYTSDMYHLRVLNEEMVFGLLRSMSRTDGRIKNVYLDSLLKELTSDQITLLSYLLGSHLQGNKVSTIADNQRKGVPTTVKDSSGNEIGVLDESVVERLVFSAMNLISVIKEYSDLFRMVFMHKLMPLSVATVPNMIRHVGVMSDTDSAVYTVQEWIKAYSGKYSFAEDAVNIGHCMGYFASTSIIHILAQMSKNMGVEEDEIFRYTMKAEYYFPVFILTSRAKAYCAEKGGQEGIVFSDPEQEIKGNIFKGSSVAKIVKDQTDWMITNIIETVKSEKKINVQKYIDLVADMEKKIMESIYKGDISHFSGIEIKNHDSYKLDPMKSNYFNYLLWDKVFAPKYGPCPEPPYNAIRVGLTTSTSKKMRDAFEAMGDKELAARWAAIMEEANKEYMGSIILPKGIVMTLGMPDEIKPLINIRNILYNLLEAQYTILEVFNIYMLDKGQHRLLSDII